MYEPKRPQFVFSGSYGRSSMFGTWYLPYPNGGGIFTEMYSDTYFGTVDSPDGTTSDSGSRLLPPLFSGGTVLEPLSSVV